MAAGRSGSIPAERCPGPCGPLCGERQSSCTLTWFQPVPTGSNLPGLFPASPCSPARTHRDSRGPCRPEHVIRQDAPERFGVTVIDGVSGQSQSELIDAYPGHTIADLVPK